MPRPPFLMLDFDGVVCDTERAALLAWQDLYDRLGVPLSAEVRAGMLGNSAGARVALADLADRLGRPVEDGEWAWQRQRRTTRCAAAPARPGVDRLLRTAEGAAIVSSSPAAWVEEHLRRLGLRHHFAFLVTGDDTDRHKPEPDLYLLALERAGVGADSALAVEDSPRGVRAAQAAGLRCVAVPWEPAGAPGLAGADAVLPSLNELDLLSYRPDEV
ncbi:HAD-IA family hydrolase [Streptomyces sp. NBC_01255]|uniref:HAD family hydrolase n=1 Tax=Streptomyces sp. NBC_01255 TaxID=2903798 RepID=UPI002E339F87|nr:HAD-IA family hydrolase [Streptomyces sp. NBC_01255]